MELRPSFTAALFLLLSLAYLAAEFVFNAMMLDVAGTIKSAPEDIERAKDFGRVVSASGFTLLALGLFSSCGFRLSAWRDWVLACIIFAVCMMPAVLLVETDGIGSLGEILLSCLPVVGLFLLVGSGGKYRVYVICGIILMSWPAMFAGQKILIEHAVNKTTWQERAEARNVLMLRASLEDCTVDIGEKWLCGQGETSADMRSVRAMITALWMHNPGKVIEDLGENKDKIVEDMALKGVWFSPSVLYKQYVFRTADAYVAYKEKMVEKYYMPYKKASDAYLARYDESLMDKEAEEAWAQTQALLDKGWDDYKRGVNVYRKSIADAKREALRSVMPAARMADSVCENRHCPQPDISGLEKKVKRKAHAAFINQSGGYPPDIPTRDAFVAHPITQEKLRAEVQKVLQEKTGDKDFTFPPDWKYEEASFKGAIKDIARKKYRAVWDNKFKGKIEPGLQEEAFFDKIGEGDRPSLEEVILSEDEFIKMHVLPKNREIVEEALKEMRAEAPLYENGNMLAEKGKNYIRAAYIPAVALVLSLVIVLMTLARGISAGLAWMESRQKFFPAAHARGWMRVFIMIAVVLFMMVGPYMLPNPYTSAEVYRKYLGFAKARNVVTASVLDWAVHIQPFIYGPGGAIKSLGDDKK